MICEPEQEGVTVVIELPEGDVIRADGITTAAALNV